MDSSGLASTIYRSSGMGTIKQFQFDLVTFFVCTVISIFPDHVTFCILYIIICTYVLYMYCAAYTVLYTANPLQIVYYIMQTEPRARPRLHSITWHIADRRDPTHPDPAINLQFSVFLGEFISCTGRRGIFQVMSYAGWGNTNPAVPGYPSSNSSLPLGGSGKSSFLH